MAKQLLLVASLAGMGKQKALAWMMELPEPIMTYLKHNTLDDVTYNKTLQKIVESLRIEAATKRTISSKKRK
jgi:hypothetical protein